MKIAWNAVFFSVCCVYAQADKGSASAKTVTVTGCIYPGVECLTLKPQHGKQEYSIAKIERLQTGHSYRITGPVSDVGFCQEGKPILTPQKIKEINLKCEVNPKPNN